MALMEFYGETCPHCIMMKPLVQQIEEELGVKIEQYEVWNHPENAELFHKHNKGVCGGVPFFINTDNGQFLCGGRDLSVLRAWAKGEDVSAF